LQSIERNMRAQRCASIPCTSLMRNKLVQGLVFLPLVLIFSTPSVQAKSAIVGDILLLGSVHRSGQKLLNDASIFEGDSIRTDKGSAGVIRAASGRLEIGESSELKIVRQNPLKIVLNAGSVALNFPKGTSFEIVTPQLQVHPNPGEANLSAIV